MSNRKIISKDIARSVAEACLCLHVQREARALARHFDDVFRPLDLTSGQYSLLMSLNRPAPTMGDTADFLAMDRTTLTANLKPLERRGLLSVVADAADRRSRRIVLSEDGRATLAAALPVWSRTQAEIGALLDDGDAERLCANLRALA